MVSFLPIVALLACFILCQPRPLPTIAGISAMPWWAPLGGLVGAFAVIAGLMFVNKVGAGPFAGLTVTANILMSLAIDHFGSFEWTLREVAEGPGGDICNAANCDLLDHLVGAGECRHHGGTCARLNHLVYFVSQAIRVAGVSEFVLDLGVRGSAHGPRWFTKTTLGQIEAKLFKHSDHCTCYGSFDQSEDAIVRTAFCPVAHAYDWQRLEHHLASIRLGKNSAPQLRQISIRLVAGFRRGLAKYDRMFVRHASNFL